MKRQTDAPSVLFYKGDLSLLEKTAIALIGTRRCTQVGKSIAYQLAYMVCQAGYTTISGLANGIDETVHRTAPSTTIGVMPCGFGATYSSHLEGLSKEILQSGGLLISEFLESAPPRKWRFIQRNRLISWLAKEIVVVEASQKSGALHTARFAIQAGQSLWAVPQSPLQHTAFGCMNLIQAGVRPLCSLRQFALYLNIPYAPPQIISVSEFAQQMNIREKDALIELSRQTIKGNIKPLSHGYYQWT